MEKVKQVYVDGPKAVMDGHEGLDRGTEGQGMDHGWLACGDVD
jgi:hypothetical protein